MVHCYKLGGLNIVLDTYSGSVHVVDEVAYDIIGMYEEKTTDQIVEAILAKFPNREDVTAGEIRQCCAEVAALKEQGKLFTCGHFDLVICDEAHRSIYNKYNNYNNTK